MKVPGPLKTVLTRQIGATVRALGLADRLFVTFALPSGGCPGQTANQLNYSSGRAAASDAIDAAVGHLENLGFTRVLRLASAISAAGSVELVTNFLNVSLSLQYAGTVSSKSETLDEDEPLDEHRLFIAPPELVVHCPEDSGLEFAAFSPPAQLAHEMRSPPSVSYYSPAPTEIAKLLKVPSGLTGEGVTVAIVDTGFYRHRCFKGYSYHPVPTSDEPDADIDDRGHGTAMAWNIFAVAPKAKILGYKFGVWTPEYRPFQAAVDSGAHVICCSWGYLEANENAYETSLKPEIRRAIEKGIIVIFAAGNRSRASVLHNVATENSWPASMPEVISVGGIHADTKGNLHKSDLSHEFNSINYPGRAVPDVCGLCGTAPYGIYFVLPTQPRSERDKARPGRPHPDYDETKKDDGWWGGSGTSSATAQIAGAAALLIQAARQKGCRHLVNQQYIKQVLCASKRIVPQTLTGISHLLADVEASVNNIP
ncbi:S8 family serine peptidase [Caballeronia calidae]|uniref:S8 family serine peptidase n=1 Tax=Caballeronia calidae TaxID=1777139 RepID=UPI0012FE63C9|nr:S8 family serine peptidase [Caballeronia calidae]